MWCRRLLLLLADYPELYRVLLQVRLHSGTETVLFNSSNRLSAKLSGNAQGKRFVACLCYRKAIRYVSEVVSDDDVLATVKLQTFAGVKRVAAALSDISVLLV